MMLGEHFDGTTLLDVRNEPAWLVPVDGVRLMCEATIVQLGGASFFLASGVYTWLESTSHAQNTHPWAKRSGRPL